MRRHHGNAGQTNSGWRALVSIGALRRTGIRGALVTSDRALTSSCLGGCSRKCPDAVDRTADAAGQSLVKLVLKVSPRNTGLGPLSPGAPLPNPSDIGLMIICRTGV